MKGLALALCFLILKSVEGNTCPPGFVQHRQSCYWFSRIKGNFGFARSICEHLGSHLATIEDPDENAFLKEYARKKGKATFYKLAADDLGSEGTWLWNGQRPMTYGDWGDGEPNDDNGEHCLDLWKDKDYKWNDGQCLRVTNFICETSL